MKKPLLVLCFVGSMFSSFAQSVTFGIKSGLNLSNISETSSGSTNSYSSLTGYHVGAFADFDLGTLSIQPAVLYTTKGGHDDETQTLVSGGVTYTLRGTEDITLNYLEVPVNVLYHVPVTIGKIFIGGGPYIAYGLSGKDSAVATATGGGSSSTNSQSSNITFGSAQGDVKNPDYGVNILGGVTLKRGLTLSVGYGIGLANLSNDSSTTVKNNGFSFSVGFSIL